MVKAYELMALAAKEPEKYAGKVFEAECALIDCEGRVHKTFTFDGAGRAWIPETYQWAYINCITEVKEVKQSVSFAEAIKAFSEKKTVYCESGAAGKRVYRYKGCNNSQMLDDQGAAVSCAEILVGKWFIGEDELMQARQEIARLKQNAYDPQQDGE